MKIIYVAGPFRGPTPWDIAQNVRRAEEIGLEVAHLGAMPLIPHANTANFNGQCDDQFWIDGTKELLRHCDALVTTPDWERSSGARGEVGEAKRLGIPVFHTLECLGLWLKEEKTRGWKVIRVSEYDYEDYRGNQRLMTRSGLPRQTATIICHELQQNPDRPSGDWYEIVPDAGVLWKFKP